MFCIKPSKTETSSPRMTETMSTLRSQRLTKLQFNQAIEEKKSELSTIPVPTREMVPKSKSSKESGDDSPLRVLKSLSILMQQPQLVSTFAPKPVTKLNLTLNP